LRLLFTATAFLSAFLLFLVQPMAAKAMLPLFGGAPAVWLVSMVFFQFVLLLGYAYAHYGAGRNRKLGFAHLGFFLVGGLSLLAGLPKAAIEGPPAIGVLQALALTVGASFFICSAHAPLLQKWYSRTDAPDRERPYYLYAASNLGSFGALLTYPLVIEPRLTLREQHLVWSVLFGLLFLLVAACSLKPREPVEQAIASASPEPTKKQIGLWIALSAVPTALLMGVINYLTQNVAPIPFLWVIPMALYLLTFVVAFSNRRKPSAKLLSRIAPLAVTPLLLPLVLEATEPLVVLAGIHLVAFFLLALMCHTRLAEEAPPADRLTQFYLWVSVGGVIGGIFVALIAPVVFTKFLEYPIALVAACLLRRTDEEGKPRWALDVGLAAGVLAIGLLGTFIAQSVPAPEFSDAAAGGMTSQMMLRNGITLGLPALLTFFASARAIRYGLTLIAFLIAAQLAGVGVQGKLIMAKRSFFGVHRVVEGEHKWTSYEGKTEDFRYRTLIHGNTFHGRENLDRPLKPLTYYYPNGPIGQVFEEWVKPEMRVGMVGLGVGSQAWYGKPGQKMTYFEIDPAVIDIAQNPKLFTFLSTTKADMSIVEGDARLTLDKVDETYDLLVLDAFSSDSVPMHLLTVEAVALYKRKLTENGIIAFHISNRYLELRENLAAAAHANGMVAQYQYDVAIDEELAEGKTQSQWMIIARQNSDFGVLLEGNRWQDVPPDPSIRPWRDDFSNLLEAMLRKMQE